MKDETKKIYDALPSSWDELKLKDFIKLGNILVTEQDEFDGLTVGVENSIQVISILTDTTVEAIEELPMYEVGLLAMKLEFLSTLPKTKKTTLFEWKKVDEITYNDFVTFETLPMKTYDNMPLLLQTFSKNKFKEADILEMSMSEVITAFFFVQEGCKEIYSRYDSYFQTTDNEVKDEEPIEPNTLQSELKNSSSSIQKDYGWHFLAKDISDFTGITFYEVYEKEAIEIFSTIVIMQARIKYNQLNTK